MNLSFERVFLVVTDRPNRLSRSRLAKRLAYAAAAAGGIYLSGCAYPGNFRVAVQTPTISVEFGGESGGQPTAAVSGSVGGLTIDAGGGGPATLPAGGSPEVSAPVK